jgi:hypothetical protein
MPSSKFWRSEVFCAENAFWNSFIACQNTLTFSYLADIEKYDERIELAMDRESAKAKAMWSELDRKKKWQYFWYYYRIHVYVGIFVLFLIVLTVRDCAQRVDADITIAYVGTELQDDAIAQLEATFATLIEDLNNDKKSVVSIVPVLDERKLFVMVAVREAQLMFVRKAEFQQYASNGAFLPLDDLIADSPIDIDAYPEVRLTPQEAQEDHIYGIPLEGNALFTPLGATMQETYLTLLVYNNPEKPQEVELYASALAIVKEILKQSAPKP